MVQLSEILGFALKRPASFKRLLISGFHSHNPFKAVNHLKTSSDTSQETAERMGSSFSTRLSMHDSVTMSLFLTCASLVGLMVWILSMLPPLSSVEKDGKLFIWRPTTVAHFQRDKELLVRYRKAYAWELFVGMTTLNIMCV